MCYNITSKKEADFEHKKTPDDRSFYFYYLHIEAEYHHVAVLHNVILAFAADKALFLAGGHAAKLFQRFKRNNLRPYKAALKVRMNLACGLRRSL